MVGFTEKEPFGKTLEGGEGFSREALFRGNIPGWDQQTEGY